MQTQTPRTSSVLLTALLLGVACGGETSSGPGGTPPPPPPPPPPAGTVVELGLGAGGGSTRYSKDGDPYDGLTLSAPAGAITGSATWKFRNLGTTSVPGLPAGYRVAGPLLEVTTEAGRSSSLMTLDVPVTVQAGEDVVLALRDPVRGTLEVMPTIGRTEGSIRVATTHLRGDLIIGPPALPGIRLGGSISIGHLVPVAFLTPQQPSGPVLNLSTERWPVLDFGSSRHPEGFGAAIPALQLLAAARGGPKLGDLVKKASQPGFYADPASFAAVSIARDVFTASQNVPMDQMVVELRKLAKADRDELVHRNVQASMALSALPQLLGVMQSNQSTPTYATAYASSVAALTMVTGGAVSATTMARVDGTGFQSASLRSVGDGAPQPVDFVVPLSSFTTQFDKVEPALSDLILASTLSPTAQRTLINQMLSKAGMQPLRLEMRPSAAAAWSQALSDTIVMRTRTVSVRLPSILGGSGMILELPVGPELARAEGAPIPLEGISQLTSLVRGISQRVVASGYTRNAGRIRQLIVSVAEVFQAPFEISPDSAQILQPDEEIAFTAEVDPAPESGYHIRWEWGDSTTTENFSINTTSHVFEEVRDHRVIATMLSNPGREVLAVDTVIVAADPAPYWHLLTFTDQDDLLEDHDGSGDLVMMLERLLASPKSGVLVIDSVGPGEKALRMHVNVLGEWDPNICCPLQAASANIYTLGTSPATTYTVGPFFDGWDRSVFTQTTPDLGAGRLDSQWIPNTVTYAVKGQGNQVGPAGAIRITALRTGVVMSGILSVHLWFFDEETNEVSQPPETFRFPFSAIRLR